MDNVVVQTQQGSVRGRIVDGIATFKGVPYAAPPFGALRFKAPAPHEPWEGVRDALEYGPTVPKAPYFPPFDQILPEPAIPGEDCLNLNIWSPDVTTGSKPVLVWIHGGAFANGSGAVPQYDGSRFARDGVVCVTINYRLGADGFLYFGEGDANRGLLDQVAALTWVRDNIAAFGGDPANVTIAGESAGGMSVTTLLSMPRAAGLFRRVIAQSGAGHHTISTETAIMMAGHLVKKLGVEPTPEGVAAASIEKLLSAQIELSVETFLNRDPALYGEAAFNSMPFEPVVDGKVLPDRPYRLLEEGGAPGVDVLVGTNAEEQRLFTVPTGTIDTVTDEVLRATIASFGLPVEDTLAAYQASRPGASAGDIHAALITDWFFRIPAVRLAEARAKNGEAVYAYQFDWKSPLFDGRLGACHALEVPFAFDTLDTEGTDGLTGATGEETQKIADVMHKAWVDFIATGDPGWLRFDPARRAIMRFNTTSVIAEDPHGAERVLWEGKR